MCVCWRPPTNTHPKQTKLSYLLCMALTSMPTRSSPRGGMSEALLEAPGVRKDWWGGDWNDSDREWARELRSGKFRRMIQLNPPPSLSHPHLGPGPPPLTSPLQQLHQVQETRQLRLHRLHLLPLLGVLRPPCRPNHHLLGGSGRLMVRLLPLTLLGTALGGSGVGGGLLVSSSDCRLSGWDKGSVNKYGDTIIGIW